MLENPLTWVAVSFFVFLVMAFKPVGKALGAALDKRSTQIAKDLKEAESLKNEARALLEKYTKESEKVKEEAASIIENAKRQADRMVMEAQHLIEQNVKNHTELAKQKIANAEAQVAQEIRNHAVEISVSAARSLILEHMKNDGHDELVEATIKQLSRKFH